MVCQELKSVLSTLVIETIIADILLAFNIHEVTTKWKRIRNTELTPNVLFVASYKKGRRLNSSTHGFYTLSSLTLRGKVIIK